MSLSAPSGQRPGSRGSVAGRVAVISASILDADFSRLHEEVESAARAGVDAFSLDVMDGHFVPRITFGAREVAFVRGWTRLPIEVHLMVDRPERLVGPMCDAGADLILFHVEATDQAGLIVDRVRESGRGVGIALKAETPLSALSDELLRRVDLVNFLAVPAGFGGNQSAPDTFDRTADLRARIEKLELQVAIEVDGGVKPESAKRYADAGADMLTVGTGIYKADDRTLAVRTLHETTAGPADAEARKRLAHFLAVPGIALTP
jgi:ribulose-phosphate 3-epimerase